MRAITRSLLAQIELPPGPVLEVGCGGGAMLADLAANALQNMLIGLDRNALAIQYAQHTLAKSSSPARTTLLHGDLLHLPIATETCAAVISLDAYDQRNVELEAALAESHRVLCTNGVLLLRVSAYDWLYSEHDIAFNTARRYTARQVLWDVRARGFDPVRSTYANSVLFPLTALLRLLQRAQLLKFSASLYTSPTASRLLATILRWEATWLQRRDIPFGISLYVIARRR